MSKQVMQQALDALKLSSGDEYFMRSTHDAIQAAETALREAIEALKAAQPAPAAPYQVTDEDVKKALGIYYAITGLDEFAEESLQDMRKTLEAHEARKAAA